MSDRSAMAGRAGGFAFARTVLPGAAAAALIAAAAWGVARTIPVVGAPVLALAAGVLIRNLFGTSAALRAGLDFTLKRLLRLAIILFGATLALGDVISVGAGSLAVIVLTIVLALVLTALFGRWLRAPARLVNLIGVGTAICGATAIITVGPILEADDEEIAFAVATIFLFNMLAVVVYPLLGDALALSDRVYGTWAGTAIHDTSSVLAAAFTFSDPAGKIATVVKLTRTLMLVPLALAVGIVYSTARSRAGAVGGRPVDLVKIFPWFVLWFVVAAAVNTADLIPPALGAAAGLAGKFLIVMVMAAVGLSADLREMRRIGLRPFYIGLFSSVLIAGASMLLIRALGI